MTNERDTEKNKGRRKKFQLYKSKKKKSAEEDAAIHYLQAQYDKISPNDIKTFKDLPLSQKTLRALKSNNYITPTEIQRQAIISALQGKDILGAAKTGSGKTLAFLIPLLENLFCKKWTRIDGVGAIVISPTRELAYQIYETLRKVGHLHDFSAGLIIGGQNLKFERKRMDQVNILICTPGRLLQHMDENPLFDCSHLQMLVLDEADRCLDLGFETTMNAIIENLPANRQTLLFSATQTKSVKDLARLSLSFPTYIAPHEQALTATPEFLQQSYIVCNIEDKVDILWSFIKNHLKQKVLVFMATCKQVKYIYKIFCKLRPGISLLALYGKLHQEKREGIYNEFCRKSNVVLFATDLASRGLDFPHVNWVIQMDCPEDVDTYIHRAGRTARGVFGKGEGLLMLLQHEEKIVQDLCKNKIPINKIFVDPSKILKLQQKIYDLLFNDSELKESAQRAFLSYLKSVFLMKNKEVFNVRLLDTDAYAKSLGLKAPPTVKFLQKYQRDKPIEQKLNDLGNSHDIEKRNVNSSNDKTNESTEEEEEEQYQNIKTLETNSSDIDEESDGNTEEEQNIKQENKVHKIELHFNDDKIYTKRTNINIEPALPEENESTLEQKTKSAVRKDLKKNILVNTKIKFNSDEEISGDELKMASAKQYVNKKKVNIVKVQEALQEKDKCDRMIFRERVKAKHKEQKRKLKNKTKDEDSQKDEFGSESESDGPDLSWLPDPDKIYDNKENDEEHSVSEESQENEEDGQEHHSARKRKISESDELSQDSVTPRNLKKFQNISSSLSVQEAEALAMQLLQAKR